MLKCISIFINLMVDTLNVFFEGVWILPNKGSCKCIKIDVIENELYCKPLNAGISHEIYCIINKHIEPKILEKFTFHLNGFKQLSLPDFIC